MLESKISNGPVRVAFYIRVSTEEQADKYGPDLQRKALDALITSRGQFRNDESGLVFAGDRYVYTDDISGTSELHERPGFARLQEDILYAPEGEKPFDAVAVFKIDRFARRLKVLLTAIDFFEEYDIKFMSVHESIDTSTPFGRAILGIIGVIAELELENIKMRTQAGRELASKGGTHMGGYIPFGFSKNEKKYLEVFELEAEIVRDIYDWFVSERMTTTNAAGKNSIVGRWHATRFRCQQKKWRTLYFTKACAFSKTPRRYTSTSKNFSRRRPK
jgi:site-specific DNA recombinase